MVYSAPERHRTLEHRTRPIDSTTHAPDVHERQDSGTSTTAGRGVFAHRNPMLSFRFAGACLLRLGARTLSALLFHPAAAQDGLVRPGPRLWSLHSAQAFCGKQ